MPVNFMLPWKAGEDRNWKDPHSHICKWRHICRWHFSHVRRSRASKFSHLEYGSFLYFFQPVLFAIFAYFVPRMAASTPFFFSESIYEKCIPFGPSPPFFVPFLHLFFFFSPPEESGWIGRKKGRTDGPAIYGLKKKKLFFFLFSFPSFPPFNKGE